MSVTTDSRPDRTSQHVLSSALAPVTDALRSAGDLGTVAGATIRQTPRSWMYFSEVLRQAGILVTGSEIRVAGDEHLIIREDDVLAVLE